MRRVEATVRASRPYSTGFLDGPSPAQRAGRELWNEPLDLSAFEGRDEYRPDRPLAAVQDILRPGRTSSMQNRKRDDAPSKRALERAANRQARKIIEPSRMALADLQERRERERQKASAVQTANRDHLQDKRPSETRKEPVREHCKQRPTKTKGNGGSRSFVPWCDRKR